MVVKSKSYEGVLKIKESKTDQILFEINSKYDDLDCSTGKFTRVYPMAIIILPLSHNAGEDPTFYYYNQINDFMYGFYSFDNAKKTGFFFTKQSNFSEGI